MAMRIHNGQTCDEPDKDEDEGTCGWRADDERTPPMGGSDEERVAAVDGLCCCGCMTIGCDERVKKIQDR